MAEERVWIDIDLDALIANYRTACSLTAATVTCVLKSNAYGDGAVPVAQALAEAGCRSFAVACIREALELRVAGVPGEILVMGSLETAYAEEALRREVTLTAADVGELLQLESAAERAGVTAQAHLKVDTGFHRLGIDCTEENARRAADALARCPHVRLAGVYSHLGLVSRERDMAQRQRLLQMVAWLRAAGVTVPETHLCDSIGLVRYPDWHDQRVRVGAFLYGSHPSTPEFAGIPCLEIMAFRTRVAQVHRVAAGEIVGYGEKYPLTRESLIATLCVGYGDGYPRCLSDGAGKVLIHGQLAPVAGLVCMDQMMADVTDIPGCQVGDPVTLLGGGISYQTYADWCGTNRNEALTILSRRPVRIYHREGRENRLDSLLQTGV